MRFVAGESSAARIIPVGDAEVPAACHLLSRFFVEEGFAGDATSIVRNLEALLSDPNHWAALAIDDDGQAVGVVTVTTMIYVEWGRLAEIGDLYVRPDVRGNGIALALVEAAVAWSRQHGCSAISVVMTPEGEAAHGLSRFYQKLGFEPSGRTMSVRRFAGA